MLHEYDLRGFPHICQPRLHIFLTLLQTDLLFKICPSPLKLIAFRQNAIGDRDNVVTVRGADRFADLAHI